MVLGRRWRYLKLIKENKMLWTVEELSLDASKGAPLVV
jgi:hypothetical protein